MNNFKSLQKGDIVICTYIAGNQKNLTLDKEYEVLKVNQSDWINSILIKIDSGKNVWFNDRNTGSTFIEKTKHELSKYQTIKNDEPIVTWIGPPQLIIVRAPFGTDEENDQLNKTLERFSKHFKFIVVNNENYQEITFEYPLNYNSNECKPIITTTDFNCDKITFKYDRIDL